MNAVIKYPGAKWSLARWIIDKFPPHHSYLEPFFGSGAVLFTKPRSPIETVNDLDNDVVNLFSWIREDPERLAKAIYWTPYAREVYEMERLTMSKGLCAKVSTDYCHQHKDCFECSHGREVFRRLSAYEDAGLKPEEILSAVDMAKIACALHELNAYKDLGPIDHLRTLLQAEQDGRLVVLPCKVGDTVYVIGEKRIIRCDIEEAYMDDKKGPEFLVSFDCDSDCDGCPFNSWRQEYSGEYSCDGEYGQSSIIGSNFGKTVFPTREEAEAVLASIDRKEGAANE